MKTCVTVLVLLVSVGPLSSHAQNAQPNHSGTRILQSGNLVVEVGDPDASDCRWNQGKRFSPVANVVQVKLNALEFCYAPATGGALNYLGGLPMEFDIGQESFQPDPPGFNDGENGDPFIKIGVGILQRGAGSYDFMQSYPVVELATTTTTWKSDRAHFVQTLNGTANGYAYRLEENLIVKNDRLIMHYVLTNTGSKSFTTEQYIHNFFSMQRRSVGPNYHMHFPYSFAATPPVTAWEPPTLKKEGRSSKLVLSNNNAPMARLDNTLIYSKEASGVPKVWVYKPDDYLGSDALVVEQSETSQRIIMDSTWRSAYVGIWTTNYQVSPEQFLVIQLAPGEQATFTRTYRFDADGSLRQDCNGDRIIDSQDLSCLASTWLLTAEHVDWNPSADISDPPDDYVDLFDLAALAQAWNRSLAPTPTAHWSLDDSAGELALDSIGQRHGSLIGFPTDDSQWVEGAVGGALAFDGVDDAVLIDDDLGIGGRQPRSIAAWIKVPNTVQQAQPIVTWIDADPNAHWVFQVDPDLRLRLSQGSGFMTASWMPINDGDWHHVAVVLDPADPHRPLISDVLVYLDGRRASIHDMIEAEINAGIGTNSIYIGRGLDSDTSSFTGLIDEVAIYDHAISPTTVLRLSQK